jgi:hypothetical protein
MLYKSSLQGWKVLLYVCNGQVFDSLHIAEFIKWKWLNFIDYFHARAEVKYAQWIMEKEVALTQSKYSIERWHKPLVCTVTQPAIQRSLHYIVPYQDPQLCYIEVFVGVICKQVLLCNLFVATTSRERRVLEKLVVTQLVKKVSNIFISFSFIYLLLFFYETCVHKSSQLDSALSQMIPVDTLTPYSFHLHII